MARQKCRNNEDIFRVFSAPSQGKRLFTGRFILILGPPLSVVFRLKFKFYIIIKPIAPSPLYRRYANSLFYLLTRLTFLPLTF